MAKPIHHRSMLNGSAIGLGGFMRRQGETIYYPIPVLAASVIPGVGGRASASVGRQSHFGFASLDSASTYAEGFRNENSAIVTTASHVRGLRVARALEIDELEVSCESEITGNAERVVRYVTARIDGVRINGRKVAVVVDTKHVNKLNSFSALKKGAKGLAAFSNLSTARATAEYCYTSVVTSIDGKPGNTIDVPDYGRIYLGEVFCAAHSYRVCMLRVELGSPNEGEAEAGCVQHPGGYIP